MTKIDTIFTTIKDEPAPPRRGRVGATTDSIALVASNGYDGVVLCHDGPGIEAAIEDTGTCLDYCGLDDAPDGLSIWEGSYQVVRTYEGDYDAWLEGTFRPLTEAEWGLLRTTEVPWTLEPEEK